VTVAFRGRAIELRYSAGLRDTAGNPAHAATFIRKRLIVLDEELRRDPSEHTRILAHEIFHFAWVRLGNPARLEWEAALRRELARRVPGEAGWSADWRKRRLVRRDVRLRTRAWREYCCESFCDTAAAWLTRSRAETTLPRRILRARFAYLAASLPSAGLPI
jgi:hypothetical protein